MAFRLGKESRDKMIVRDEVRMHDREKLIKRLENLLFWLNESGNSIDSEAVADVLSLLIEREGVEPTMFGKIFKRYTCGACGKGLNKKWEYCPNCGWTVKWE